jgi:hypothetical protein
VPEVVPRQRRDAVALLQAEALQGIGELARARECLAKGVAVTRMVRGDRNDLAVGML